MNRKWMKKKRRETDNKFNKIIYLAARKSHALNGNYFIKSILLTKQENVRQSKETKN